MAHMTLAVETFGGFLGSDWLKNLIAIESFFSKMITMYHFKKARWDLN